MNEQDNEQKPAPSLPVYPSANTFIHPKQQRPLMKMLSRMLKPKVFKHAQLRRTKKKHQVKFY